jgi:hypothetical protein
MLPLKYLAALVLPLVFFSSASAQDQQPESVARLAASPELKLPSPAAESFAIDAAAGSNGASGLGLGSRSGSGYVRVAPAPRAANESLAIRPFRSIAIGFTANTLGASVEFATPVSRSFNLRSSVNVFAFDYPFAIDGVNYDARLHLKSTGTTLDWFPLHGGFHISPGFLYVKNSMAAGASVGAGMTFTLGSQQFTNSVDDPVNGSASVVFPNKIAPMLLLGFGNIIPRSGRHLSFPFEFGAAYTGVPRINVALSGTACTSQGCSSFAQNAAAQSDVTAEVDKLNEDLKRVPVYPILSMGVAYRF